jgi:hypothetical protein
VIVASSAGVALACAAAALWPSGDDPSPEASLARILAGQPLVVFVMIAGVRRAARRPSQQEALATFRLAGMDDDRPFREGARRAAVALIGLPALLLLAPAHALALGAPAAAWHFVVGALLLLLVADAAIARDPGLPFAGPAEQRDNQVAIAVVTALLAFVAARTIGWLESLALQSPIASIALPAALAVAWLALRWHHSRAERQTDVAPGVSLAGAVRLDLGD